MFCKEMNKFYAAIYKISAKNTRKAPLSARYVVFERPIDIRRGE